MLSRHLRVAALTTLLASVVNTQSIVPTSSNPNFPGCALSCSVLLAAQITCTPPYVAQTNQLAYDNCFCQSSTLQAFYTTPDSVCAVECTIEDDRQILQRWFTSFCQQVGQGVDPVSATQTTLQTTVAGGGSNGQATATNGASSSPTSNAKSHGPNWFSTHWKWVVMVIVLFCGLILIALLAVFCKRRYRRKRHEKIARMSGFPLSQEKSGVRAAMVTPDLWGPHQHMAMTQGYQYSHSNSTSTRPNLFDNSSRNPDTADEITVVGAARTKSKRGHTRRHSSSKRKQKEAIRVEEQELTAEALPTRSRSSRPRPSELDVGLRAAEAERSKSRTSTHSQTRRKGRSTERRLQGLPEDLTRPGGDDKQ